MPRKQANRSRNVRLQITATEEEAALIRARMAEMGVVNMGAYARKMMLDGCHVTLDLTDIREMTAQLSRIGNNINQIAKRANETRSIYASDFEDLKRGYSEIWDAAKQILSKLAAIK